MMAATGWQAHSVRGAMAGALKKRGMTITSAKVDGVRVYRTLSTTPATAATPAPVAPVAPVAPAIAA